MKPFLKWAGSKYKIVERILTVLPKRAQLIEPFVGSGAVFLNTDFDEYVLGDGNADLIGLYQQVQSQGTAFIEYAQTLFSDKTNTESAYYALREEFNDHPAPFRKAALFIYLNRHGFNGLCRYNSKGGFNVPFGRYTRPHFPTEALLGFYAKSQRVTFLNADFRETLKQAGIHSVVYCDPPYAPLTPTANFSSYTAGGFNEKDQIDLMQYAEMLSSKDVPVLISNHDTDFTRALYKNAKILSFDVQRFISRDAQNRKKAAELIACYGQSFNIQQNLFE